MKKLGKWLGLALGAALLSGCFPVGSGLRAVIRTEPNPARGPYPLTVEFDGSASAGRVEQWIWTIFREGEENPLQVLSGERVRYTFPERGRYRVYLEVRAGAAFAQAQVEVDVRSKPPVAAFLALPTYIHVGQTVEFDATASRDPDGQVVRYFWNFDDGTWLDTPEPVVRHTYSREGTFRVRLVVEDDYGDLSEPMELRITVARKCCGG